MMLTTLIIRCDGRDCTEMYPHDRPLDGAIFTHSDVRAMARQAGWKRDRIAEKDYCFHCAHGAPVAKKAKAAR